MPTLTISKNYSDGVALTESMIDDIRDALTTFLNSTKIDGDNIQTGGVPTEAIANNAVTKDKLAVEQQLPAGMVSPYAGTSAPTGWLLCAGQAVNRTTYATLFAALSTTYGVGDGSTTFNLPDLRGRVVAGKDNMNSSDAGRLTSGNTIDGDTLGTAGGSEVHTLTEAEMPSHDHSGATGGDGGHSHTIAAGGSGGGSFVNDAAGLSGANSYNTGAVSNHTHTIASAGSDTAHANVQPTLVLNYIVKT